MSKAAIRSVAMAAVAVFLASVQSASAGVDAIRAEAYFNAIAGGNAETITSFYADNAEFHWVGGPLAGVYKGKKEIREVWEKFSKAAGDIKHEVLELSESQNGKVSTVTARVNLIGPKEVPVKFVMLMQEGKIISEIWQVDKPVTAFAAEIGKPEQYFEDQPGPEAAAVQPPPQQDNAAGDAPVEETAEPAATPAAPAAPQEQDVAAVQPEEEAVDAPAQAEAPDEVEQAALPEAEADQQGNERAPAADSVAEAEDDAAAEAEAERPQAAPAAKPRVAAIPALPAKKAEDDYVAKPKKIEKKRVVKRRNRVTARRNYDDDHRSWRRRAYGYDSDDGYGYDDFDDYYYNDYRGYGRYRGYGGY